MKMGDISGRIIFLYLLVELDQCDQAKAKSILKLVTSMCYYYFEL